ncbi:MAG: hypothetical protein V4538_17370 [Bacteroidota bacterium]
MTIETKFNIGDEIHFIENKKACSSKIRGIKIEVVSNVIILTTYLCNKDEESNVNCKVEAQNAFASKAELLKSL